MSSGRMRIADAGAIVALFDLVPPALALILDHGGLFEEDAGGGAEEVEEGAWLRRRGEELPAGEDGGFAGAGADVGLELDGLFAAFEGCACGACAGEAGVDGGEEFFGDGGFGKGEEESVVELELERWVSGSNLRMDSISSPKKSMRTGRSCSGE